MKKNKKKWISLALTISLGTVTLLSGCSTTQTAQDNDCPYEEFITVDVFDNLANYQGIQSGWFGKVVKDKFNMELNIIAPNVSGGGDTVQKVREAAGNLGDLIICSGENGAIQDMVNEGLLYNMETALQDKDIMKYKRAIDVLNEEVTPTGIYAIPSLISSQAPDTHSGGLELNYGPYLRWDIYAQLGYPRMETLSDLLLVLAQMKELYPENEEGEDTYAFSFFKDWDDNMMNAAKQLCCFYGYDEYGFILAKADGSDYQNILADDSLYLDVCRLYFEANRLGLVDPDSPRQTYSECHEKYRSGRMLFSYWPWMGQDAYNTLEHTNEGKGFMLAPIEDMQIYAYGCNYEGSIQSVIAVGSQAKEPERLVDFIDWLYSDEGVHMSGTAASIGPQGLVWEMAEDGPYLTDYGKKAMSAASIEVPEEYGGSTWEDGRPQLNFKAVAQSEKDSNGYYFDYELWDSVRTEQETPLLADWKRVMQAESTVDYLEQHDMLIIAPGCAYQAPAQTFDQLTIRNQCKKAIQEYSWRMVFAQNKLEFERLLIELRDTVYSYGYADILQYDLENAQAKAAAGLQAVEDYYTTK